MKHVKRIVCLLLVCILSNCNIVEATSATIENSIITDSVTSFFNQIKTQAYFSEWDNGNISSVGAIYKCKNNKNIYKYEIESNEKNVGYILVDEYGKVIAYSKSCDVENFLLEFISEYEAIENTSATTVYSTRNNVNKIISNVSPQLQSGNCISGALANVLWYYAHNGYPSLMRNHETFTQMSGLVNYCMYTCGGYANNNIPAAVKLYLSKTSPGLTSYVDVYWNSNAKLDLLISEINDNRPIMLGYAKGSYFSDDVGHMTMCYGYNYTGGNYYAYLASGWYNYGIFVLWDDNINDCIITIDFK